MAKTKNFDEAILKEIEADEKLSDDIEQEILNARIAMELYRIRSEANLTQEQLAVLVKTKQPVIARLENASYSGRSLSLLFRIARALKCRINVSFEKTSDYQVEEFGHYSAVNDVFSWPVACVTDMPIMGRDINTYARVV